MSIKLPKRIAGFRVPKRFRTLSGRGRLGLLAAIAAHLAIGSAGAIMAYARSRVPDPSPAAA